MKVILEHAGTYIPPIELRDYFAIEIVQAMISNNKIYQSHPDEKSIVTDAYIVANYMMEARK
jgi:hypothetical protein